MKGSEVIAKIAEGIAEHGDVPVVIYCRSGDEYIEVALVAVEPRITFRVGPTSFSDEGPAIEIEI